MNENTKPRMTLPQRIFIEHLKARGGKAHIYEVIPGKHISSASRLGDALVAKGVIRRERSGVPELAHLRSRDVVTIL